LNSIVEQYNIIAKLGTFFYQPPSSPITETVDIAYMTGKRASVVRYDTI